MSRQLLWFPSQKHVFCCQMQRPGTTPWATLGLRAYAPYEERLEGISAGIGVLAPGPFWRVQIARFQDEWVFLQLEIVRQASMKSLKMICVIKKSLTNGIVCCFSCQRSLNVLQKKPDAKWSFKHIAKKNGYAERIPSTNGFVWKYGTPNSHKLSSSFSPLKPVIWRLYTSFLHPNLIKTPQLAGIYLIFRHPEISWQRLNTSIFSQCSFQGCAERWPCAGHKLRWSSSGQTCEPLPGRSWGFTLWLFVTKP